MKDYRDIIELIIRKDPLGLKVLYEAYGKKFYAHAVSRWKLSEDQAWDVVYKTLEALVLKLPAYQFESKAHFDNFLYKVLTNFLRQLFRQLRSQEKDAIEFINIAQPEDGEQTGYGSIDQAAFQGYFEAEIFEHPMLQLLTECLEKLNPLDKDLLLLRAQNYTYDEIAELLKIENKQLKVRYLRAKQKLIAMMNETQPTLS